MKIKITYRWGSYVALVTFPWGERVRFTGCDTRDDAERMAYQEIEARRRYILDRDLGIA